MTIKEHKTLPDSVDEAAAVDSVDAADRELMERLAGCRDHAAMEQLYLRYRPRLLGFLRRLTDDQDVREEAYNDIMVKVWEKAHQYQGRSKVSSWIFSIAYRTCLRMVKKQQRRDKVIQLVGQDLPEIAQAEEDGQFDDKQIQAAVRGLPAKQRIVVELCYFEGYSLEEIGRIVKCPQSTVKTRLHYARKKIQQMLEIADALFEAGIRNPL